MNTLERRGEEGRGEEGRGGEGRGEERRGVESLEPDGNRTTIIDCPVRSAVSISTALSRFYLFSV
jgi:hypothetical protein